VSNPVLPSDDASDNLGHDLMFFWRLRDGRSFVVCRGDIGKQVASVLFADDFDVNQRKKQGLADTKGGRAIGIVQAWVRCHLGIPSTASLPHQTVAGTDPNWSSQ
jgi:hypothetical protein